MTELLDESSYDHALAVGALIVNVDTPTKVVRGDGGTARERWGDDVALCNRCS